MADVAPTTSSSTDTGSNSKDTSGGSPKAIIKNVDMSEDMQQEAVDISSAALEKYNIEKDIAAQIKKEFDRRHGPTWHVVVGKNFGSYVTHGTPRPGHITSYADASNARRDEALHLLLRRLARHPHLEVMNSQALLRSTGCSRSYLYVRCYNSRTITRFPSEHTIRTCPPGHHRAA
jgi:dynein light chain LC8-type